ncbi:MAG: helix-turn-helix transcriptional regulator [Desulfobacteraceae bacterium]|nr:helix-turn-helix transcriptional regulator [Desulfobacteraceae bacterium]
MKKHHTKTIELHLRGPAENAEKATQILKKLGFVDTTDSVPWRDAFLEFTEEEGPAVCLRAMRRREGLTQKELSARADIPQAHISLMERGKMPIGVTRARRLGKALNAGYKIFL